MLLNLSNTNNYPLFQKDTSMQTHQEMPTRIHSSDQPERPPEDTLPQLNSYLKMVVYVAIPPDLEGEYAPWWFQAILQDNLRKP
jgi:hypothetical protein